MIIFRGLILQRSVCFCFLVAALASQTQLLYACDVTDGKPRPVCCCGEPSSERCPMDGACPMPDNTGRVACCEVSHDSLTDTAIVKDASNAENLTISLTGPQPPPVVSFHDPAANPSHDSRRIVFHSFPPSFFYRGNQVYLLTRRLRL